MRLSVFVLGSLLLGLAASPARADIYQFTIDHCTGGCGVGTATPGGTIEVTNGATNTVHIVVTLASGLRFVDTGFAGSFGFNILPTGATKNGSKGGPTITVSNVTPSVNWTLLSTTPGAYQVNGFGDFDYLMVLQCPPGGCSGGSTPINGPLSFDVTASGLTKDSFKELSHTPPGSAQVNFVADVLAPNGNTGPIGALECPTCNSGTVPEPTTITLLSAVMLFAFRTVRGRFV